MHSSIRRITRVAVSDDATTTEPVYKKNGKSRKSTKAMKPAERMVRRVIETQSELADQMLDRHNKSSRKRKDGWIQDGPKNASRAFQKAMKTFTKM
jgi:hypothetical protein